MLNGQSAKILRCKNVKMVQTQKYESGQHGKFPIPSKKEMLKWSKLKNIKGSNRTNGQSIKIIKQSIQREKKYNSYIQTKNLKGQNTKR